MESRGRARLSSDARREQLLRAGVKLLGDKPLDEVSIEEIAAEAGVSKGLLYHYFPRKRDFVLAVLRRGQRELAEATVPDRSLDPDKQIQVALDRFLDVVESHPVAYSAIYRSGGGADPEMRAVIAAGRQARMDAVIEALEEWGGLPFKIERTPILEAAVQGWLFFTEGAVLHWLEQREFERFQLRELLARTLVASVMAAAGPESSS